jgi:hypothetical protein
MSGSESASLQDRLRFFRPPLPAVPSPSLTVRIPPEVGHNGLTQLTAVELRASLVGARLPVGLWMSLPGSLSGSPPHVPFGHSHQPLGPFLTHERGMPFTSVQPSGASLGRFCLEAGRLRPLSPELSHLPVTRDARLGRDTWTSQDLRRMIVGHTLIRVALHQRPFAGRKTRG